MNLIQLDKGIFFRLLICIVLAGAVLGLFLVSRPVSAPSREEVHQNLQDVVIDLDRNVDTMLANFKIEKQWIKRRQIEIPGTSLYRIERKVFIPKGLYPLQMNVAFNTMAKQYDGRAIASENLKENLVTMHIKLEGYVLQTIVLKPTRELPKVTVKTKLRNI